MSYLNATQKEKFQEYRRILDGHINIIVDNTTAINDALIAIREWKPGVYEINDVRIYNDIPYKCALAHDSTANETWNPKDTPNLWIQYHGTSKETARPWVAPTGAHDMYKVGEYMIYEDEKIYKCLADTTYSPDVYGAAWEVTL